MGNSIRRAQQLDPARPAQVLRAVAVAALLVGALAVTGGAAPVAAADPAGGPASPASTPAGPVGHDGRWLTDAQGRVLLLNGVNMVDKQAVTFDAMGFGEDDAAWLEDNGIDAVRLGFSPRAIMPTAGKLDVAYLDSFERTVDLLASHGLLVLIDLHQDGWGPAVDGNGFPAWMTLTHGAENTHTGFPLYYITNPAIQASFDSFWANEKGPGGVPLQDRTAAMFSALAERLAGNPAVLGYDLMNEPWPGTDYEDCLEPGPGCPDREASALDPYHARMTAAIRAHDPDQLVFGEPFVLFNFGETPTGIEVPGGDPNAGMSFHVYTLTADKEPRVVDEAKAWSARTGGALLNTEFGATTDTAVIDRMISGFDHELVPWMFWAYDESVVRDLTEPAADNVVDSTADAVVRPHPLAVAGTPTALDYDLAGRILRFDWSTKGTKGQSFAEGVETSFQVAPRTYPDGYQVKVVRGRVTSEDGARLLTVVADPGAVEVRVLVWAAGEPEPPLDRPAEPAEPDEPTTTVPEEPSTPEAEPAEPVEGPARFTG